MTENNDRELLEKAAKALGWRMTGYSERRSTGVVDGGMAMVVADGRAFGWSPLHNDGDAFRLQVRMKLEIRIGERDKCVYAMRGGTAWEEAFVHHNGDREAATRRAIVRAAASIGDSHE